MRRGLDVLHAASLRLACRCDFLPAFPVVARYVERSVIGSRPYHSRLQRRFPDCVERAIELLTRDVDGDRLTGNLLLPFRGIPCQIRRDAFPRRAFIARSMQIL